LLIRSGDLGLVAQLVEALSLRFAKDARNPRFAVINLTELSEVQQAVLLDEWSVSRTPDEVADIAEAACRIAYRYTGPTDLGTNPRPSPLFSTPPHYPNRPWREAVAAPVGADMSGEWPSQRVLDLIEQTKEVATRYRQIEELMGEFVQKGSLDAMAKLAPVPSEAERVAGQIKSRLQDQIDRGVKKQELGDLEPAFRRLEADVFQRWQQAIADLGVAWGRLAAPAMAWGMDPAPFTTAAMLVDHALAGHAAANPNDGTGGFASAASIWRSMLGNSPFPEDAMNRLWHLVSSKPLPTDHVMPVTAKTTTVKVPKCPPREAWDCWRLNTGRPQTEIAELVYGDRKKQSQVSRNLRDCRAYLAAGGVAPALIEPRRKVGQAPVSSDPSILDAGQRTDRLTLRQRANPRDKGEDDDF
jgi:hypothetical protein